MPRKKGTCPSPNKDKTYIELYGIEEAKKLKEKLRISHLGYKATEETKKKMSIVQFKSQAKKRNRVKVNCSYCGKELIVENYRFKQAKNIFCNTEICHAKWLSENKSGENCHHWQGGKSFEPYSFLFNQQLKDRIRVRDNFICQLCGIPELECNRKLAVHHIDYNKKNCADGNLISLCTGCNTKVNYGRNEWEEYFKEKLNGIIT